VEFASRSKLCACLRWPHVSHNYHVNLEVIARGYSAELFGLPHLSWQDKQRLVSFDIFSFSAITTRQIEPEFFIEREVTLQCLRQI